jgi:hypothetical protein
MASPMTMTLDDPSVIEATVRCDSGPNDQQRLDPPLGGEAVGRLYLRGEAVEIPDVRLVAPGFETLQELGIPFGLSGTDENANWHLGRQASVPAHNIAVLLAVEIELENDAVSLLEHGATRTGDKWALRCPRPVTHEYRVTKSLQHRTIELALRACRYVEEYHATDHAFHAVSFVVPSIMTLIRCLGQGRKSRKGDSAAAANAI